MPLELGPYVIAGELINRRHNLTHGWLALRDSEQPVILQFTGDPSAELVGKRLRFSIPEDRPAPDPPPSPLNFDKIAWQQIGPTGEMKIVPADGQGKPEALLRLEWFSQNGHVVVELLDPVLEWVENDDEDDAADDADEIAGELGDEDAEEGIDLGLDLPDDEEDDPYGLFPPGLDDELSDDELAGAELPGEEAAALGESPAGPRDWDEVIPGIDPETKRMYEDWDEVTHGTADVPLREIFDPPIRLYTAEQLVEFDDATVEAALKELLKRLALLGVAIGICEHFTPQKAYRYLAEEILPEYGVNPRLPQIGWVQHYDTSEDCPECQAEFERRWAAENPDEANDENRNPNDE
jgi:hypothetical protein